HGVLRVFLAGDANNPAADQGSAGMGGEDESSPQKSIDGVLLSRAQNALTLLTWRGPVLEEYTIRLEDVARHRGALRIEAREGSLKPTDYMSQLSPEERDALVKMIAVLN